ncbi:non-canonical purine NTP pyrophosphatase [Tepiditoga spiralis]|uniref:dITP/XTP pyrophosphatase n=1 Tax=Tepiditoga spiralis TaxID=2108365 RepID=A0A7G1G858_9BACT|nr:RdgB/HAM1 family non-canonical purine NTP pyrophosphatase [Tepiditoga spiralis]BBE31093.1 non-canonical purine NTP pyrophosphatase [Tepiditoga spiralis]
MKAFLATSNKHKVEELNYISPNWIEVSPISDLFNEFNPEETGSTFIENSVIKAVTGGNKIKKIVLADDSGLCIESLDGFPGIKSSRFMEGRTYEEKMKAIFKMLEGKDRKAYFACAATYYNPMTNQLISYEGRVYGKISEVIRGHEGFGYDPFFIPDGYSETFGILGNNVKKEISHRARAFNGLFNILNKII